MGKLGVNLAGEEVVYIAPNGDGLSLQDIFWDMKPPVKNRRKYDPDKVRKKPRHFDPPTDLQW